MSERAVQLSKILKAMTAQKWGMAAVGVVVGVGVAGWLLQADDRTASGAKSGVAVASAVAPVPAASVVPNANEGSAPLAAPAFGVAPAPGGPISGPLGAEAQAVAKQFRQLAALPAGDSAIALSRQLEAGINASNIAAYVDALLNLDGPAGERAAVSALARVGTGNVMQMLASAYGDLPAERRGRILLVLENATHPDAMAGLQAIVARETGERGSPLLASAMVGMAHLGTQPSIEQLMALASGPNDAHALNALQRVATRQGVELLRAAAAGGKGHEALTANQRATFGRVADVAESALPN